MAYNLFFYVTSIVLFPTSPTYWSIKNTSKPLFYPIRSFKHIIWRWCLKRISSDDSNSMFSKKKKSVLQHRKFFYLFYYNGIVTKHIYFWAILWKSWVLISDNIVGKKKEKEIFPYPMTIKIMFLHSEICWIWKTLSKNLL